MIGDGFVVLKIVFPRGHILAPFYSFQRATEDGNSQQNEGPSRDPRPVKCRDALTGTDSFAPPVKFERSAATVEVAASRKCIATTCRMECHRAPSDPAHHRIFGGTRLAACY
jgi:hypothetical protein